MTGSVLFDLLSALTLRALRLCGESWLRRVHRRDAENAEVAQRKPEIEILQLTVASVRYAGGMVYTSK